MKKVQLGNTGIEVSKLGFGTGTAHPSGHCAQARLSENELAELLVYAFDRGVNFWDTAFQYHTHGHIKKALRQVDRHQVVLATKVTTAWAGETATMFDNCLRQLGVEYVDVCLLHGVRTESELHGRQGALDKLLDLKKEGKIRAMGISSHGLPALQAATAHPDIEVVWARINFSGQCMDELQLGLYDQIAARPCLKKYVGKLIPKKLRATIRVKGDAPPVASGDRRLVEETLAKIHATGKGIVGMKVLAEGHLGLQAEEAIRYVKNLHFVDSLIIGMLNKNEVRRNCAVVKDSR